MTLHLDLSEDEQQRAEARARELGHPSLEAYLLSLLNDDTEVPVTEEVEAELRAALRTPAREFTPADWDRKRQELLQRHGQQKAG